ncbi:hypothetical protein TRM7557_01447 [Tritonibacter multivorans]|uniref:Uncharacterized protein n=1 Tax=Tritonibacter multivorans TaxID=928856 RepID=A0A0N7LZG3_9RHOB|nr:SiaB family protein kinase [Tritonibacter multivorans]MDA7421170.1 SiaB family protein kinase [Tritonibacter multivorans]CUH77585.1 hypothetical protein TRM7557_01447 [Tritonibacter multivorans]SFD34043.1 hypothetical protein SAMN04488049_111107 [Tritonibacter multivorans]
MTDNMGIDAKELYQLRSYLRDRGILFAYSGYVTETVLSGVGEALRQKLALEATDTKTVRSVFAIFVEQMQNIIRYSAETEHKDAGNARELRYGVLTVAQTGERYAVHAGNVIHRADQPRLETRLAALVAMDRDALKSAYKTQLKAGPEPDSKGASVGLIEIARRASAPLGYGFTAVDEDHVFFAIEARI